VAAADGSAAVIARVAGHFSLFVSEDRVRCSSIARRRLGVLYVALEPTDPFSGSVVSSYRLRYRPSSKPAYP